MAQATPHLTLYFLQASRSIRIAWLLEELRLPYALQFSNRENQKAPAAFKRSAGGALGKFPCLRDGQADGNDIVVWESGACVEYIVDNYDVGQRMMPEARTHAYTRSRIQVFVHAAEGSMLLHALAILYFRWQLPEEYKASAEGARAMAETEERMGVNVNNDLAWLEAELGSSTGGFLVGNEVTAADVMMHFSVEFTVERELGVKKGEFTQRYPKVEAWLQVCVLMSLFGGFAVSCPGRPFFRNRIPPSGSNHHQALPGITRQTKPSTADGHNRNAAQLKPTK